MNDFQYHNATSLEEVFGLLETHGDNARVMAGGTALVIMMKQRLMQPEHVVSLRRLPGLANIEELLNEAFPEEVAVFVISLIEEAEGIVGDSQGPLVVIALLVALYSGSRGIYAVQKALRQIQRVGEERPWWKVRGLGILFTFGAGVALVGGYFVVLFGGALMEALTQVGLNVGSITGLTVGVLFAWVVLLLVSIYRWGPPLPIDRPLLAAFLATSIIALMTWAAAYFVPSFGGTTLAALGAVGIVLLWLFSLGYVVIVVPALTKPAELVIRGNAE